MSELTSVLGSDTRLLVSEFSGTVIDVDKIGLRAPIEVFSDKLVTDKDVGQVEDIAMDASLFTSTDNEFVNAVVMDVSAITVVLAGAFDDLVTLVID